MRIFKTFSCIGDQVYLPVLSAGAADLYSFFVEIFGAFEFIIVKVEGRIQFAIEIKILGFSFCLAFFVLHFLDHHAFIIVLHFLTFYYTIVIGGSTLDLAIGMIGLYR